ncbi:MAG: DUF1549 domain-containing protein, partial [Acidobacteria bacterium]|nr:DUF1549 domain-containing protein [Acidobacteriota bacterium]
MRLLISALIFCGSLAAQGSENPTGLALLPGDVDLRGPRSYQRIVVEATYPDGHQKDVTTSARLVSADPKIASIDRDAYLRPVADGTTMLTASFAGRTATARVRVEDAAGSAVPNFRNHVLPVMTKVGCNSGACHGALAGKNGFKLTLRAYDPEVDYQVLTREGIGRRVSRLEPAQSLILLKPTFTIPHGGGKRFEVGSPEYNILVDWIASGAPPPSDSDPRIQGVEIFPRSAWLEPGAEQQVLVRARYSDGHTEDVTRWVKFSSTDSGVASVDDVGKVNMLGSGEAAVTVWYQSQVGFARLGVPNPNKISAEVYRNAPRHNYIDELSLKKLEALHIDPSLQADDNTFIRRAYLDAMGILPTPDEVDRFVGDRDPNKRSKLIDDILARDEFVDYWAYKWSDLLLVSSRRLRSNAMWSYYNWIRDSVAKNKPWDQFVREILVSSGNSREVGALNYYIIHKSPIDMTENVTQAFLGLRITCARCHNHPLEKWTQRDYYQMANLFSRISEKNGAEPGDVIVYSSPTGEMNHPRLGRPLPPKPLDGEALDFNSPKDRRRHLAQWLTSAKNPYFARALVNKVWHNFMGRGLVEPVDDVRATNPASDEELFAALTKDFIDSGFDVKRLVRTVMNSAAYQRSSAVTPTNEKDEKYYSHYIIKRLPAEVILDAISEVTRVPSKFEGYPEGTRALQLPDSQVNSYFLTVFGRPPRIISDSGERQHEPTITQALHVINGETLNQMLAAKGGTIDMFLKLGLSDSKAVDHVYLSAFSRYPTEQERKEI